jgi:hypothetical protein
VRKELWSEGNRPYNLVMSESEDDHRDRKRHQVLTPIFFMVTQDGVTLKGEEHTIEGEVLDLSEAGLRMRSSHMLAEGEEVSFEVISNNKTVMVGVAEVVHCLPEQVYGLHYLKVRRG